jgi:hypothetical protein
MSKRFAVVPTYSDEHPVFYISFRDVPPGVDPIERIIEEASQQRGWPEECDHVIVCPADEVIEFYRGWLSNRVMQHEQERDTFVLKSRVRTTIAHLSRSNVEADREHARLLADALGPS